MKFTNYIKFFLEISPNEYVFNQLIPYYEKALKKSGYNISLKYTQTQNQDENNQQREQRKRKITCFNPPYSLNVRTKVRKLLLKLLDIILQGHINVIRYLTATHFK